MRPLLSIRLHLPFSLLMGLLTGFLVSMPGQSFSVPAAGPTPNSYWQVQVNIYREQPPSIERIALTEGDHSSHLTPGESLIQLLSDNGGVLYEQTFHISFVAPDLPGGLSKISYVFILPDLPQARMILLRTPQGETRYELPH